MENKLLCHLEYLVNKTSSLGINIDNQQGEKLLNYMGFILEWNQNVNLTAITDEIEFIDKHIIDSLIISRLDEFRKAHTVIDIGTGGGFPGVPLSIIDPSKQFLLVDSLLKRIKIVKEGVANLGLENISVIHGRGENLSLKGEFETGGDVVIARAVANMAKLSGYTLPNVKTGGYLIAFKGPNVEEEIKEALPAIKKMGGKLVKIEDLSFDNFKHTAVICRKK